MNQKILSENNQILRMNSKIITKNKFILRFIQKDDAKNIYEKFIKNKDINQYSLELKKLKTIEETRTYLDNKINDYELNNSFSLVATIPETDELIALISIFNFNNSKDECEIECTLAKDYQNNEYSTEVLKTTIIYLLNSLKVNKIWTGIFEPDWITRKCIIDSNFLFDLKKSVYNLKKYGKNPFKKLWFSIDKENIHA